jgi:ubiquinone/menaquinone biosynthesis C-methylase UbiE
MRVNKAHLELCSSDEWAAGLKKWVIPNAIEGIDLGDDLLEVGPGPGRTTDILRAMAPRMTAVEIDASLADALAARMTGSNVTVINADATEMPLPDERFSAAVSFTMLHHVPTDAEQDRLFGEVARVLRKGGIFAGVDSLDSPDFRALHLDDICNPIEPGSLQARLLSAGFSDAHVEVNPYVMQFRATK